MTSWTQLTREQQIAQLEKDWAENPRWKGIKRGYSAADVVRLRGSMQVEHTLAQRGAEKLWSLINTEPFVNTLGALTGNQAMQQVKAGLKAPSYDGRVHAYWLDKTEHGSWPFEVYDPAEGFYRFATEPIVADLDNDGKAEVIFASWTQNGSNAPGKLYIVSWDGNLLQSIDLPRSTSDDRGGSLAAPTIANIDSDLDMEIVVGTINKGLVAYDVANSSGARILWGTGRGSLQRTGLASAVTYNNGSLDNSTKSVSDPRPDPGESLAYTIRLINPGPMLSSVRVTDTLPVNASLVNGSVAVSSGSWGINSGVITWTGSVPTSIGVTLTYVMTTSSDITLPTVIINTALINDGLGNVLTRSVAAIVNGYGTYLPMMRK